MKGGAIVSTLVMEPKAEHLGDTAGQYAKIVEMRAEAAVVMEFDTPMTRYALCKAAGWPRGRSYDLIPEAFPAEGARVVTATKGTVVISTDAEGAITMRQA